MTIVAFAAIADIGSGGIAAAQVDAPPTVTLTSPANGSATNDTTPTYSGAAGAEVDDLPSVTVKVYGGASATGTPVQVLAATPVGATWSIDGFPALVDGLYTAQAEQSDAGGNVGTSDPATFKVDATAPAPTVAAEGDTKDTTPELSGTAGTEDGSDPARSADGLTITVRVWTGTDTSGEPHRTVTADRLGSSWDVDVAPALAEGTYTAIASQGDGAGNTGSSPAMTFKVDTTAPQPTVAAEGDTKDTTPNLSGGAGTEDGSHPARSPDGVGLTVRVWTGTDTSGPAHRTLSATRSGSTWAVDVEPALVDGTYTATASQGDGAENIGPSPAMTFKVDATAPAPTVAAEGDTKDTTPNLSGTAGTEDGSHPARSADGAGLTVRVWTGTDTSGPAHRTLSATRSGSTWAVDVEPALVDGTYTAIASQGDGAENVGPSPAMTFKVDATAPAPTVAAEGDTNDPTPNLSGTAGSEDGSDPAESADGGGLTLRVWTGTDTSGPAHRTLTATRSGSSWNVDVEPALVDGTYTAIASQGDGAGNTGSSPGMTFEVDATAPAPTVDAEADANDTTPNLSGTAGTEDGSHPARSADGAGLTVRVWAGTDTSGPADRTLAAARSGSSWNVDVEPALGDGTYTAIASQNDAAGNVGNSPPRAFAIETVAPRTTIDSGPSGLTNDPRPTFAFSSSEPSRFLCKLYAAGQEGSVGFGECSSPRTVGPLGDGDYVFEVAAVDTAGNQGSSTSRSFRVDATSPATAITAGPADTTATNGAFLFSASEPAGFSCRIDGGSWQPCGSPYPVSGLALGPHRFEVKAVDQAGNEGSPAAHAWQVLKPGLLIPAAVQQAVALATEIVQMRKALKGMRLRNLAKRKAVTIKGFDALTAGTVELRAKALVRRRPKGKVRRITFLVGKREVEAAGRYAIKAKLTKQGRRLARRQRKLPVELRLTFTDLAGRALWATTKTTLKR